MFLVEDILTGEKEQVNGKRLKVFRSIAHKVSEELKEYLHYQRDKLLVFEGFDDMRRRRGVVEVLVKWCGFQDTKSDWVTIKSLPEDVPFMFQDFWIKGSATGSSHQKNIATYM